MIKRPLIYLFLAIGIFFSFAPEAKAASCTFTGTNWGKEPAIGYLEEKIAFTVSGSPECGGKTIRANFYTKGLSETKITEVLTVANPVNGLTANTVTFRSRDLITRNGDQSVYFKAYPEGKPENAITSSILTLRLQTAPATNNSAQPNSGSQTQPTQNQDSSKAIKSSVSWWPIVQCGLNTKVTYTDSNGVVHDYSKPCQRCDLFKLAKNLIDFIMFGLIPPIAVILFTWAGFLILISGGQGKGYTQGKTIFRNTFFGFLLIMLSWVVTNTIIRSIATDNVANNWWQFECQEKELFGAAEATIEPEAKPGEEKEPQACLSQGEQSNLCNLTAVACSNSKCGQYKSLADKYASGAATANLLKAIMVSESSCDISKSTASSYGLMMLSPNSITPSMKTDCQISGDVTPSWLMNPANADKSVCLAAKYINSLTGTCGTSARNLAAGYNGGIDACNKSVDCAGETSCDGSPTRKWECLYDDKAHTICNKDRPNTSYAETRLYAPKVAYCAANPGF